MRLLCDRSLAGTGPLDRASVAVFAVGPLWNTPVFGSSRDSTVCNFPLDGRHLDTAFGGRLAQTLKSPGAVLGAKGRKAEVVWGGRPTGVAQPIRPAARLAERICNLERVFNVWEGTRRAEDTLPHRTMIELAPDGPRRGMCCPQE